MESCNIPSFYLKVDNEPDLCEKNRKVDLWKRVPGSDLEMEKI